MVPFKPLVVPRTPDIHCHHLPAAAAVVAEAAGAGAGVVVVAAAAVSAYLGAAAPTPKEAV